MSFRILASFAWLAPVLLLTNAPALRAAPEAAAPPQPVGLAVILPAFDGEISGDLNLLRLPPSSGEGHVLNFHWTTQVSTPQETPDLRCMKLLVSGSGVTVDARATVGSTQDASCWHIEEGHADLAQLLAAFRPYLPAVLADAEAEGRLEISGSGGFLRNGLESPLTGKITANIANGALRDTAKGWSLEGISLYTTFPDLPRIGTGNDEKQVLTFRTFQPASVGFHDGRMEFSITPDFHLYLQSFTASVLGGHFRVAPFTVDLNRPSATIHAEVADLDASALAPYLASLLAELHGKLRGEVDFKWDPYTGLSIGNGNLRLQPGDAATIRFAKLPGFLTANIPLRFNLLSFSWKPLQRLFSVANPVIPTLQRIEEGEATLTVESMDIRFISGSDDVGRSAYISIVARPDKPGSAVKVLRLNLNVYGPLAQVLRISLNEPLSVDW